MYCWRGGEGFLCFVTMRMIDQNNENDKVRNEGEWWLSDTTCSWHMYSKTFVKYVKIAQALTWTNMCIKTDKIGKLGNKRKKWFIHLWCSCTIVHVHLKWPKWTLNNKTQNGVRAKKRGGFTWREIDGDRNLWERQTDTYSTSVCVFVCVYAVYAITENACHEDSKVHRKSTFKYRRLFTFNATYSNRGIYAWD